MLRREEYAVFINFSILSNLSSLAYNLTLHLIPSHIVDL